jgi:hypothetical protein
LETDALIDIPLEAEEITLGVTEVTGANPYLLPAAGLLGALGVVAGTGYLAGELAKKTDLYKGLQNISTVDIEKWRKGRKPIKFHQPSDYATSGAQAAEENRYKKVSAESYKKFAAGEEQYRKALEQIEKDDAAYREKIHKEAADELAKLQQWKNKPKLKKQPKKKSEDSRVLADYIVEEPVDTLALRNNKTPYTNTAVVLSNTVVSGLFGSGPLQSILVQLLQKYAQKQLSKGIDLTKEHLTKYAKDLWDKLKQKGLGGLFKSTEITKINDKLSVVSKAPSAKYTSANYAVTSMARGKSSAARGGAIVSRKSAPVSRSTKIVRRNAPRMSTRQGNIVITHSEMIGHVVSNGAGTYSVNSFRINAGDTFTFPWLSSIAKNFEKYKFLNLGVAFVSGQATSMPGKVGLGVDFDPADEPPSNRVEFFTLTAHTEAAPWDNLVLNIPCKGGFKFTDQSVEENTRLIDMGQILVMNDLATPDSVLGDLIVSYSVELSEPQPKTSDVYCMETASQYPDECTDHTSHSFVRWSIHNTSTEQFFTVPTGYYVVFVSGNDPTTHTFGFGIRSGDGEGYYVYTSAASVHPHALGSVHMTSHEGEVKITSSVAYNTINVSKIVIAQVDKQAYDTLNVNMVAIPTY